MTTKTGKFVGRRRDFYGKSDMPSSSLVIGIHFRGAKACLFQRLEDKGVPSEDPMVAKKGVGRIGCEILLARWKVRRDINLRPEPVCYGLASAVPTMKFAGDVAADLDSHPTAAVVINPIHGVIGVVCGEGIADHGVPLAGEVAPAFLALWKSYKDRPHRATHLGMRAVASGHDWRDVIEVVHDHLVS